MYLSQLNHKVLIAWMVHICVDSTKSLTPALEVAGIKAVNDLNASDITTNPDDIDTVQLDYNLKPTRVYFVTLLEYF